ncbi:hypothetical protein DRQ09_08535 [candidate division KSB1 bacterium]|nr:MAG: hypothetical protein DRQ09_08535 [candidate division KSB1 bacterium]
MRNFIAFFVLFLLLITIFPGFIYSQDTWFVVSSLETAQNLQCVFFLTDDLGWVGADSCLVFKTTDGGNTWERIYVGTGSSSNFPIYDIQFINQDSGFVGSQEGDFYVTTDGGASWIYKSGATSIFTGYHIYGLYFQNALDGWIVGGNGKIAYTNDAGDNWTQKDLSTTSTFYDIEFISNKGWIVGYNNEIFHTTDNGTNWVSQGDTLAVMLNMVWILLMKILAGL